MGGGGGWQKTGGEGVAGWQQVLAGESGWYGGGVVMGVMVGDGRGDNGEVVE